MAADRLPTCVIEVGVETAFFQCGRAVLRSRLWDAPETEMLATLPSTGAMLDALTDHAIDGAAYDAALPARQQATLY